MQAFSLSQSYLFMLDKKIKLANPILSRGNFPAVLHTHNRQIFIIILILHNLIGNITELPADDKIFCITPVFFYDIILTMNE